MEILARNFFKKIIQTKNCANVCDRKMKHILEMAVFMGSKMYRKYMIPLQKESYFFPHFMKSLILQNFPNESRVKAVPHNGVWHYFHHSQSKSSHFKQ